MNEPSFQVEGTHLYNADSLSQYSDWPSPHVIVSDGGYGVSGFKGDANSPDDLGDWYQPHIKAWSEAANPGTTLWFWNTEIGWATVHPLLKELGWDYVGCNTWNKGLQHIAGNCNLPVLKGFPVVTEVCVHYVRRPEFKINGQTSSLKRWLRYEWLRTGLPLYKTNDACGVANAATRKYFTKDHLWYAPPPDSFAKLVDYANKHGDLAGRPYFSLDGENPAPKEQYERIFPLFEGKYGVTNVWDHPPLHNGERIRIPGSTRYAHLNQKPLALMKLIIEVSSREGEVVWEPFGGLCSAAVASMLLGRRAYAAEIDRTIFRSAVKRLEQFAKSPPLEQLRLIKEQVSSMESYFVA